MYLKIDTQAIWDEKYLTQVRPPTSCVTHVHTCVAHATILSLLIITLYPNETIQ